MTDYGLDLAVIGNGRTAALLEPSSRIVWWCLPRYDGDPVFCRLLSGGEDKGFTDVVLEGQVEVRSDYVRNTAVVVTDLIDDKGAGVRVTDFAPRFQIYGRTFRPPQIIRIIEPIGGMPRITIRFRTTHRYGEPVASRSSGSNHIRYWRDEVPVRLTTDAPLSYVENEASFILTRPVHMVFGTDEPFEGSLETTCRDFCERTRDYWLEWVRRLAFSFDWQDEIIRAGITLKLCSYEETGAIVAALTTSIPEVPKSGRNWDYRFCWMRDAFFVVRALNRIGATRTMEDFISYILSVSAGRLGEVRPLYGVVHTDSIEERTASALSGYGGDGLCASKRGSIRASTMSMAASSWRRRQCSSTAGCLGRAMHRFFTRSSRSGNRRRSLRSSPMPASGSIVGGRASYAFGRDVLQLPAPAAIANHFNLPERATH
jgi:GH15 family glucan-1,4-alpha-glucosidase